jgi:hypothetical protein
MLLFSISRSVNKWVGKTDPYLEATERNIPFYVNDNTETFLTLGVSLELSECRQ